METPGKKSHDNENLVSNELVPGEVVIGFMEGISGNGSALVDFQQNTSSQPIPALSTLAITSEHIGRQVALLFTGGDINSPLIIGFIHNPLLEMINAFDETTDEETADSATSQTNEADFLESVSSTVDGKRVVLEGKEEVVLKCGEASITLTSTGKIMIRGKYILNRSTGLNRILGGSVQVN